MPYTMLQPMKFFLVVLSLIATINSASFAQQSVDVGLFRNGNELEVRLRPQSDFDGVVSNVVFSIRWNRSSGITLGAILQPGPEGVYIPLQRSDLVREDGPFDYQIFAGFGMQPISTTSQGAWRAGMEYVIARIPFNGNTDYSIVTDTWTKKLENNGDFYISLGGQDLTGTIYKSLEAVADQMPFSISPNPNLGQFTITMPMQPGEDVLWEVLNNAGQVVLSERPNAGDQGYRRDMDLRGEGAGVYHLRISRNGSSETHQIVVN